MTGGDGNEPKRFAPRRTTSTGRPGEAGFEPGQRIAGYVLRRFVGAGGMGQVWEAEEAALGRTVALKLLPPHDVDSHAARRFEREAQAGARIRHANLVSTYAHGIADGQAWIAQEFVAGAWTLADAIAEQRASGVFSQDYDEQVAELVQHLAEGLHAAHEEGVLHRDVKPGNVLVDPTGRPRLVDFGLARVVDESAISTSGDVAGTWAYMSPEQVRASRRRIDRRTDVFSLGAVLYELLTLRRAFHGDSVQQTAARVLQFDPPHPSELRSGVSRDLSTICMKALEKSPERRYETAAELAADLGRFLDGEPVLARPPGPIDRVRRSVQRHPAWSAGLAVGIVTLSVVSWQFVRALEDARSLRQLASQRSELAQDIRAERDAVLRLADTVAVETLLLEQAELWPPWPERIEAYVDWIERAEARVAELPRRRAEREELLEPQTADEEATERRWWQQRLTELITSTEALRDTFLTSGWRSVRDGWSIVDRLAFARELERSWRPEGDVRQAWDDAFPRLVAEYEDVPFETWVDLVPLGPDPLSGFEEFAALATGIAPERDSAGRLVIDDDSAVVLVLVPGGSFWMGMQSTDPTGVNYDPDPIRGWASRPVREVMLSPYLFSKYELTNNQWERLTGESAKEPGNLPTLPVKDVSAAATTAALLRVGLTLPTEAQWEHACRAGTQTPYYFGDAAAIDGKVNVLDRTAYEAKVHFARTKGGEGLDDGYVYAAPVDGHPANAFGVHAMHGNVQELCRDAHRAGAYAPDESAVDPVVPRVEPSDDHVVRGGCYQSLHTVATSWFREAVSSDRTREALGCRPARELAPEPIR